MINQRIKDYQIISKIGEGGMAIVYEGTQVTLGTKAAIKILNPLLAKKRNIHAAFSK